LRRKTLTFDEVLRIQSEAESLVAGNEHEVDSRRVLELVRDSQCSAYNCEFVALAARLGTKVATMDAKVLKAFPQHAVALSRA
jgi:predicted nucleic acid-binding protein